MKDHCHLFAVTALLALICGCASVGKKVSMSTNEAKPRDIASEIPEAWITQKLDHTNAHDLRTFQQRTFIDSSQAFGSDAPIFLQVCGESPCDRQLEARIGKHLAEKFRGHLVALEHRYYGKSLPFPGFSSRELKFLTFRNALEDMAAFLGDLRKKPNMQGPVIAVGTSYSAMLAANMRARYPNLVAGALSSSGLYNLTPTAYTADEYLAKTLGPACLSPVQKTVSDMETELTDPSKIPALRNGLHAKGTSQPDDILNLLGAISVDIAMAGKAGDFCSQVSSNGARSAYFYYADKLDRAGYLDEEQMDQLKDENNPQRSWAYQRCIELGGADVSNPDPTLHVRSSRINPDYIEHRCQRLFGVAAIKDMTEWRRNYYLPLLDPKVTRILFTNGEQDVWSVFGISPAVGNDTNPNTKAIVILGAGHSRDGLPERPDDSDAIKAARAIFENFVKDWISKP